MQDSGFSGFGAGKVSWKADGSALAYGLRTNSAITQIAANPSYGAIGEDLPVVEKASPSQVAWSPTPATKDQYLYSSGMNVFEENVGGIYLNSVGDASGGTQLVTVARRATHPATHPRARQIHGRARAALWSALRFWRLCHDAQDDAGDSASRPGGSGTSTAVVADKQVVYRCGFCFPAVGVSLSTPARPSLSSISSSRRSLCGRDIMSPHSL